MNLHTIRGWFDWKYRSSLSRFLLVFLSGFLTILAFPHEGAYSLLSWVCMVPWLLSLHKAKWWERIWLGFLYGCLYILPGHWMSIWTPISSKDWSFATSCFLITLFFSCYVVPFVFLSWLKPYLSRNHKCSVFRQCAFITCLFVWFPTYFPVTPACMIHDQPLLYQTADFGGMAVVIFTVLFVNLSIAEMILQYKHKTVFFFHAVCLAIYILLVVGYGYFRITQFEQQKQNGDGKSIEIIAVQTRIRPMESMSSLLRQNSKQKFSALEWSAYAILNHPNANLIILPEDSIGTTNTKKKEQLIQTLSEFSSNYNKTVFFNYAERVDDSTPAQYYNSSQMMLHDGTLGDKYRKVVLTPVYEHNPIQNIISIGTFHYIPGTDETIIPFENANLIPSICYEVHSTQSILTRVRKGGEILVHMGNFQSFGSGVIAFFDLAMVKLRAVEHRIPIVRSCNWGYGAFIEATGIIVPGSFNPPTKRIAHSYPLFIPNDRTVYTTVGDLFLYLLTTFVFIDLIWLYRLRQPATR